MDGRRVKQLVKQLERSLGNWDYQLAVSNSQDETQTRDFLIHPFFETVLGYSRIVDFSHEIIADVGTKRGRKVDIAITLGGNKPLVAVECKKATATLSDNHFRQLNEYCRNLPSVKVGILTNGVEYRFYTQNQKENNNLYEQPFFVFNLNDYATADLETLALFNKSTFEMDAIIEEAEEVYFVNNFDDALFQMLSEPSEKVLKEIFTLMGGKRSNETILLQIKDLINSSSLKVALDKIMAAESKSANSGIVTTHEELKAYNVVKTILAMSSKVKNQDLDRIGYRDMKHQFAVLVDDNQKKKICSLILKERVKVIEIAGVRFDLDDVSIGSLTGLKKQLTESAISCLVD